jgi:hypothetical protein
MLTANKYSEWDANDAEFELIEDIIETPLTTTPTKTIESPQWQEDAGETEPHRRESLTHYNRAFRRKRYDTWFGRIQVDVLVAAKFVREEKYGVETSRVERLYKFMFTFKPNTWLFRPGLWRLSLQQQSADADHRFNVRPSYSPIVPHDAPIFQLCEAGNVHGVVGLLEGRHASVYDIDSWGRGLLHMAARSQSPELIKYLLDAGCVRGSVDEYGNSPLDLLPFFQRGSGSVLSEKALMDVVRLLIEEADCATNFTEISNRCCNNFLQNLCKYRRVLDLAELTPIIHYLLTRGSFWIELNPQKESDKYKSFNPLSDMLYNEEKEETILPMSVLLRQHSVDVTAIAEFGYSTMQDVLMQEHDMAIIVALIRAGAWLHTKNAEAQTPTRVAWWRRNDGQAGIPFAQYKKCNPPTDRFEIYEFLLYGESPFSDALQNCYIDLWEFATNEAAVLDSEDPDEPLQYLTAPCYHRVSVDTPVEVPVLQSPGPLPYRRKSRTAEPD